MNQLNVNQISQTTRQILPLLESLTVNEKDFLIEYLKISKMSLSTQFSQKNVNRLGQHKGMIKMRDDFNDYLGDDFWLGESHD